MGHMTNLIAWGAPILLAEPDQLLARSMERFLLSTFPGCRVHATTSVSSTVAALCSIKANLVIAEVRLLGYETGHDLLRWLKVERPGLVPHTVFMTSDADLIRLHHPHVIEKPAGVDTMRALLTNVISAVSL